MKNLITFVLFGKDPRYWSNVPYLLVANSAIYQDFSMRFYIHEESMEIKMFEMLQEVSRVNKTVEIEIIREPYIGTKLTTWRVKPLWENDINILLCRDSDYAINMLERKSVEYFMYKSDCVVQGIRSYHLHTAPYMAGLCGFKVKEASSYIKSKAGTFNDFISWGVKNVSYCSDWRWGCDQAILRDFLYYAGLYSVTMDCPQYTAPLKICSFPAKLVCPDVYEKMSVKNCCGKALLYSESISPSFTGQPWSCNTDQIRHLCRLVENSISEIVRKYI